MLLRRNETTDLFIFCVSILLQAREEHYKTCMGFQPTLNPCVTPQEFNFLNILFISFIQCITCSVYFVTCTNYCDKSWKVIFLVVQRTIKLVTSVAGIFDLSGRTDSNTVTPENSLTNLGFGSLSDTIVNKFFPGEGREIFQSGFIYLKSLFIYLFIHL